MWYCFLRDVMSLVTQVSTLLPWSLSMWILVILRMVCRLNKMHPFLSFLEIDKISFNLLQNDNEAACHNLQRLPFKNIQIASERSYLLKLTEKFELLINRMQCKSIWLIGEKRKRDQKEWYNTNQYNTLFSKSITFTYKQANNNIKKKINLGGRNILEDNVLFQPMEITVRAVNLLFSKIMKNIFWTIY